jgi:hypothetical protein
MHMGITRDLCMYVQQSLKVQLYDIFSSGFLHLHISNLGMRIRLLSDCDILLEFAEILIILW